MELSTVVFLSFVLCGMGDVHAGESLEILTTRVGVVEQDLSIWKFSSTKTETRLMNKFHVWKESLKEELISTFLPSLIEPLVKQAITNILTEDDIGHQTNGKVLVEVHSLKDNVQYIKTRLRAITRDLRHVERERDTYRKSVRKERSELTNDIRALQKQVNETIDDVLETNQTLAGLTQDFMTLNTSCVVTEREIKSYREGLQEMRRNVSTDIQSLNIQLNQSISDQFDTNQTLAGLTQGFRTLNTSFLAMWKEIKELSTITYHGTTEAAADPSPSNTFPPAPVTTQDLQASTTDASENLTPTKTVPPPPVTTQDSDTHATPSAAAGRDLYDASWRGDLETVKRILAQGHVDINYRRDSVTPVMAAAWYGHRDVVEFLVGRGADVSLVDEDGDNVLHYACYRGDLETVKLILSMNVVDINSRGKYSRTPVMMAAWYGHRDVVEFLVGRGADVSLVDSNGDNVLHLACIGGDLETVKLILSMNVVDINGRGWNSRTPVMRAAVNRHRDVVKFLVDRGADVSLVDSNGDNALHLACYNGDVETVKLILSMNVVDINVRNNDGKTAADIARDRGHQRVVDLLV